MSSVDGERDVRAMLAPLRAMPPASLGRPRGLAMRRLAIWPVLAIAAVIVAVHPSVRASHRPAVVGTVVPRPPAPVIHDCPVNTVLFQAVKNGTVARAYSLACLQHVLSVARKNPDLMTYSQVESVLRNAIARAAVTRTPPPGG
jgi:hypothetical protein